MDSRRHTGAGTPASGRKQASKPILLALGLCAATIPAMIAIVPAAGAVTGGRKDSVGTQQQAKARGFFSGRVIRRHLMAGSLVKVRAHSLDPAAHASGEGSPVRVSIRVKRDGARDWQTVERLGGLGRAVSTGRWRVNRPGRYRAQALISLSGHRSTESLGRFNVYRGGGASWYGGGGTTACGQHLTDSIMGVAHKTLPCGTKVTFRYHGRTATARVIDRGPFIAGRDWDLTPALKRAIGFGDVGQVLTTR